MDDDQAPKTQETTPKGIDRKTGKPYPPIEIPVPKRSVFDRLLDRAEKKSPPKDAHDIYGDTWIDQS
jgi:hypothetical protein